jgi:hypothetical protein
LEQQTEIIQGVTVGAIQIKQAESPNKGVNLTAETSAALTRQVWVAQQVTPGVRF